MTQGPPLPIAPGAIGQLTALVTTALVALALVGLPALVLAWRARGQRRSTPTSWPEPPRAHAVQLLGGALLLLLLLPAGVALRQLWPWPGLERQLLVTWLFVLLVPGTAWIVLATVARRRGPR